MPRFLFYRGWLRPSSTTLGPTQKLLGSLRWCCFCCRAGCHRGGDGRDSGVYGGWSWERWFFSSPFFLHFPSISRSELAPRCGGGKERFLISLLFFIDSLFFSPSTKDGRSRHHEPGPIDARLRHYGTKSGHFETSKNHFPTSEGVSEVSERANE